MENNITPPNRELELLGLGDFLSLNNDVQIRERAKLLQPYALQQLLTTIEEKIEEYKKEGDQASVEKLQHIYDIVNTGGNVSGLLFDSQA